MNGSQLKALRKAQRLTQAHVAELLGLSTAYVGELEREEKSIDNRLAVRIGAALLTYVDVSFSNALQKWTITVTGPVPRGAKPGRRHEVLAVRDSLAEAVSFAEAVQAEREIAVAVRVYDNRPPQTTNPSGV